MGNPVLLQIDDIINKIKSYQSDAPISMVQQAYEFAYDAHKGQIRVSGEEYICHPLGVAKILSDLHSSTLISGIGMSLRYPKDSSKIVCS